MNELKTLKDLEYEVEESIAEFKETLKAEAVKWVKEYRKHGELMITEDFKHFFNLTEEDLKEVGK